VLRESTEIHVGMSSFSEKIGMEVGFEEARTNVEPSRFEAGLTHQASSPLQPCSSQLMATK
jgi:hypothetical protein